MTTFHLTDAAFKPYSPHATYSKQPITNTVLTCIFQIILGSSQTGSLSWLDVKDFTAFSSTCRASHINSQRIWKNLLIHHNYGCLKTSSLTQILPAMYKVIFLQLSKLQISFETPRLIYKAGERGCKELMDLLVLNANKVPPEKMLFVNTLPKPTDTQAFVGALIQDINKFKKGDKENARTPILQAIRAKDINLVHAMLTYDQAHADSPRYKDPFALRTAIEEGEGQPEIARLLIQSGADFEKPDSKGTTLLMTAASTGKLEIVQLLIESNADVNALDHSGWNAFSHGSNLQDRLYEFEAILSKGKPYIPLLRQQQIMHELVKRSLELTEIEKNPNICKKHKTENAR